jgi:hypothetical protein
MPNRSAASRWLKRVDHFGQPPTQDRGGGAHIVVIVVSGSFAIDGLLVEGDDATSSPHVIGDPGCRNDRARSVPARPT